MPALADMGGQVVSMGLKTTEPIPVNLPPPSPPAQLYPTPPVESVPDIAWQPASEYSSPTYQVAYTTQAPDVGVTVGGSGQTDAATYYYIDGKLIAVGAPNPSG